MLDGWYCRSIANLQAKEAASVSNNPEPPPSLQTQNNYSSDNSSEPEVETNYRSQYLTLKRKLKFLIYENECFQEALKSSQKRLLKVSRDRSFLLDRLLQYEKPESTTSESEETDSSDNTNFKRLKTLKKKKPQPAPSHHNVTTPAPKKSSTTVKRKRAVANKIMLKKPQPAPSHHNVTIPAPKKSSTTVKRKRTVAKKPQSTSHTVTRHKNQPTPITPKPTPALGLGLSASDGHMTPEEVERHLQSRQSYLELLPQRAPPTVPTEMFSNDPSLDRL